MSQSFYNHRSPLSSLDSVDPASKNGKEMVSIESLCVTGNNGRLGKRARDLGTGYPKFMLPAKHHPYRRLRDDHVEVAMKDAIRRVEEGIKAQKNRKLQGKVWKGTV